MFAFLCLSVLSSFIHPAPVAGPDFNNLQYLHTLNLTYSNNTLQGLGAIDNLTDVDSGMAESLKAAINRALPSYLAPASTPAPSTFSSTVTPMPETNATRSKRSAVTASSSAPTSSSASPVTTSTQPYGTDEEFYARTDLVHFQVNIDDLEGSG